MRRASHHQIEIKLRDLGQLFNSMDPSPFHEKDLDDDAEEFITSWAQEYPRQDPLTLVVHLQHAPLEGDARSLIEQSVHHFYAYRAKLNRLELKRLLKKGRQSLMVGLSFLGLCLLGVEVIGMKHQSTFLAFVAESLTIAGWVAMWRPLEIYLYDWWPLRRKGRLFAKLSHMPVVVRMHSSPGTVTSKTAQA